MKPRYNKRNALTKAIGGLVSIAAGTAWGQAVPPDAGQLMGTVKEPVQAPRKSPTFDVQQEVRPALSPASGFKVAVKGFRFSGNSAFSDADLLPLVKDLAGQELDLAALDQAAGQVSSFYRRKGYFVARAYLPAQEIKDGIVEIAVIEGRIGSVTVKRAPGMRLSEATAQQIVTTAAKPGQPITEKNVERGLLLLNDLPGVDVKSTLVPGATPGASDLVVEATEGGIVGGSVDVDNYGNRFTGRNRFGASININDPTGRGDQVTLRGMTSGNGMDYGRASYMAPVGNYGTKLGAAVSDMHYKLGGDFAVLQANGQAQVYSLFGLHPFVRSRDINLYGVAGYDYKTLKDNSNGINMKDKRVDVANVGITGDSRDGMGGGGMWSYGLSYASGRLDLSGNATDQALDQSAAGAGAGGSYGKTNYNLSRLQRLSDRTSLYASFSGQNATKNLDTSEKFILGGLGVRAYPQGEAPGDEGYLLNVEGRYDLPGVSSLGNLQFIGFLDSGWVKLHKSPWTGWNAGQPGYPNTYRLSGLGLGLNFYKATSFSVRASYAWKLGNNPGRDINNRDSDNTSDNGRFWVQAVKWF
jgi:hemolysin activation/secretion protein